MDLTWLEDLQALADSGNFSRAAALRHVTQPAFSRRIRALEDWVGVKLFDRSAQPVVLTEAGRRLQLVAGDVLRRLLLAREDARAAGNGSPAVLRFAATHVLSFTFFPGWMMATGQVLAAVHLVSDSLQGCERLMLLGQGQFLLCHHHHKAPSRLEAGRFTSVRVGGDTLCPVTAPDAAGRPRFTLGAGGSVPVLAYSRESGLGRIIAAVRPSLAASHRQEPIFTSHLAAALRTMTLDGHGIAWLPMSLIAADLAQGRLVRAGEDALDIDVDIRLFRPDTDQGSTAESFWSSITQGAGKTDAAIGAPSPAKEALG